MNIHTVYQDGSEPLVLSLTRRGSDVYINNMLVGTLKDQEATYAMGTRIRFEGIEYIINAGDDPDTVRLTDLTHGRHWGGTHKVADCHNVTRTVTRTELVSILGKPNFEITLRR